MIRNSIPKGCWSHAGAQTRTESFPTLSAALFSCTFPLICARLAESGSGMQKSPTAGKDILPHFSAPELCDHNCLPWLPGAAGEGGFPPCRCSSPGAHAVVLRGQPAGPDKATAPEGFMRLLPLNRRQGEVWGVPGELEMVREVITGVCPWA